MSTSAVGTTLSPTPGRPPARGMVWIPGGSFTMGSAARYPEEAPAHRVVVKGGSICHMGFRCIVRS
jgi:sulfatase modifying factor 1